MPRMRPIYLLICLLTSPVQCHLRPRVLCFAYYRGSDGGEADDDDNDDDDEAVKEGLLKMTLSSYLIALVIVT